MGRTKVQAKPAGDAARPGLPVRLLRLVRSLTLAVALAGLAVVLGFSVVPRVFGYGATIVAGASMGEALPLGSVAFTRDVPYGEIKVGDTITFQRAGASLPVTHRVVAIATRNGQRVFQTKGDANATPDATPVVVGTGRVPRAERMVPYAGYALRLARGPMGLVLFLAFPAVGLLLDRERKAGRSRAAALDSTAAPEGSAVPHSVETEELPGADVPVLPVPAVVASPAEPSEPELVPVPAPFGPEPQPEPVVAAVGPVPRDVVTVAVSDDIVPLDIATPAEQKPEAGMPVPLDSPPPAPEAADAIAVPSVVDLEERVPAFSRAGRGGEWSWDFELEGGRRKGRRK